MSINFELYKVFYYVAKHLSFSEAASDLYISQSAVSQAVKQLETSLGCRLFVRTTKQVSLTQEGERLFSHIEQAFHIIKTGERAVRQIRSLQEGEIKIGASDTICKYYLLPYLRQFIQRYPNIKLKIINRTSPVCLELLKKGAVDLAAVNLPACLPEDFTVHRSTAIRDVFIAGPAFERLRGQTLSLTDLACYPLLMLEKNTVTRHFFDELLATGGVTITPEVELGSVDLLIELTKIGLGLSFVAEEYVATEVERGEIFILDVAAHIPYRYRGIVSNRHIPLPLAAQKFIEML